MNPGGARRVGLVQRVGERINMDGYLAGGGSLGSAAGWRMVRAEGRRRGHNANRLHDRRGSGTRSARRNLQPSPRQRDRDQPDHRSCSAAGQSAASTMEWTGMRKHAQVFTRSASSKAKTPAFTKSLLLQRLHARLKAFLVLAGRTPILASSASPQKRQTSSTPFPPDTSAETSTIGAWAT